MSNITLNRKPREQSKVPEGELQETKAYVPRICYVTCHIKNQEDFLKIWIEFLGEEVPGIFKNFA